MSDRESDSGSTEVGGDVRADQHGVAAGRDIQGGVHTGPETINNIVNINVGALQDTGQLLDKVQDVKQVLSMDPGAVQAGSAHVDANVLPMQTFQASMPDPYQGGAQWLPQLQQVAGQQGSPWVPTQTQGLAGIDLTGVWVPLGNPMEVDYVRQAGPTST